MTPIDDTQFEHLITWFCAQNGTVDTAVMGLAHFPNHGRGAVALQDIPEGHTLFTIPRDLTLSTRTSSLPTRVGREAWRQFGLGTGWVGLILCMMWEESLGSSSKWSEYLSSLPASFNTPMFWSEEEVQELSGTAVVDKIGRSEAERDYYKKLIPAIESRPDLFPAELTPKYFSLERYHMMGSRILSRSFHVEPWREENEEYTIETNNRILEVDVMSDASHQHEPLDAQVDPVGVGDDEGEDDETVDDDDMEDPADVTMVPMADMLNASFEAENAKLFYEKFHLKMVTTKPIKAGEQIWNTYGDPPNSDLLRRYGYVDVVPLRPPQQGEGNPADVVEIRADLVVSVTVKRISGDVQERVDWWLENADDDTFVIGTDCELPEELMSFVRLLLLPQAEWDKARCKGRLPKAKIEAPILMVAAEVLEKRLSEYRTTIETDEALLAPENVQGLSFNKKHAVIVRLGEKRILRHTLQEVKRLQDKGHPVNEGSKEKKRNREVRGVEAGGLSKKAKR
ncbi:hypothetical protein AcV7_003817 [Taiwanofungus camphoratus]|nr:hypothetical protein AcV7_003817 [Antrodia cinnamomea]